MTNELENKTCIVFVGKPRLISIYTGHNGENAFKKRQDKLEYLRRQIAKTQHRLHADDYIIGESMVSWSSDPGFGSRCESYAVQFYNFFNEHRNSDMDKKENISNPDESVQSRLEEEILFRPILDNKLDGDE